MNALDFILWAQLWRRRAIAPCAKAAPRALTMLVGTEVMTAELEPVVDEEKALRMAC